MIKVGFGPKTPANSFTQSGVKVAQALNAYPDCECATFGEEPFRFEELAAFDVLVFIKVLPDYDLLKRLKDAGKILILDYQDMFLMPSVYESNLLKKILKKAIYAYQEKEKRALFSLLDLCFVSSPVAALYVKEAGIRPAYIVRQIYNDRNETEYKQHNHRTQGVKIIWTGVGKNLNQNAPVEGVLRDLCRKHQAKVIYLTDYERPDEDWLEYHKWTLDNWETDLLQGDIAFRWWTDSNDQYHKDSNKIQGYMAAGLPVVCRPTLSDEMVMKEGRTGFFAQTPDEFAKKIEALIINPDLRKMVGQAAHKEVWGKYSLKHHVKQIHEHINKLINK